MRRNRIIWLFLWIISVIGISFYGGSVTYGSFIILSLIPLVSLLYILCVISQFKVYQKTDGRNLVCDHPSQFYFTLQNESYISFSGIRIGFFPDLSTISGIDHDVEYELAPKTGIKKQTGIICRYRGEYEVGIRKLIVTDFFRLFSVSFNNREPLRVIVKPNIVLLEGLKDTEDTSAFSRDLVSLPSEPDVTLGEYTPSDDIRMVSWKATAATRKLMVRERTATQQSGITIIMDPKRYSRQAGEYLPVENKILEAVIALALYYSGQRTPVSVYYRDKRTCESLIGGPEQFEAFYELMSGYSFDENESLADLFTDLPATGALTGKGALFLIAHKCDEKTAAYIRKFGGLGLFVTVCLVTDTPEDEDLPSDISRCRILHIPTDADLKEVL